MAAYDTLRPLFPAYCGCDLCRDDVLTFALNRVPPRYVSRREGAVVTEADFDDAYTFKYSVRDGTAAVRLKDHVPDEVASERLARLIEVVRANVRRKNMARLGETHEVLVERPARRGHLMLARTRTNQLVLLDLPATAIGEYQTVRLTGTTGSTFTGAVVLPQLAVL